MKKCVKEFEYKEGSIDDWRNRNQRFRDDYEHNAIEGLTVVGGLYLAIAILGACVWGITKLAQVMK